MRILRDVTFEQPPVLLAAWPGMGNVGLIAMDYLRRKLGATSFAEIDMSPYFIPESIVVKDGVAQFPEIPTSIFTCCTNPSVMIFESNVQLGGHEGIAIIRNILDLVRQYKVKRIYTSAAFAQPMSFQTPSTVLAAGNTPHLVSVMQEFNITPMPDGYIAGLNGLILGVANAQQVEGVCFLGTIPSYATSLAYPKASAEIVRVLARIVGVEIDMTEMEQAVAEMDQQLGTIEERIKQFFPGNAEQDEEMPKIDEEKVPHYIMEKIEKLFREVAKDKSLAPKLKEELDRWKLYELYENRFLDLFDDDKKKKR